MRTFLFCAALLLAIAVPADAVQTETARYVVGLGTPVMGIFCSGFTEGTPVPEVGGACEVPLHSTTATVSVVDDLLGPVSFYYVGIPGPDAPCEAWGYASSPVTLSTGCVGLRIFPQVGSLAGTIAVSS